MRRPSRGRPRRARSATGHGVRGRSQGATASSRSDRGARGAARWARRCRRWRRPPLASNGVAPGGRDREGRRGAARSDGPRPAVTRRSAPSSSRRNSAVPSGRGGAERRRPRSSRLPVRTTVTREARREVGSSAPGGSTSVARASARARVSAFAESISSGDRSRSSGARSCQPVPRRATSTRGPVFAGPTGSRRSSSISSACAKNGDRSTSALRRRPERLEQRPRDVHADTRPGVVRTTTTSSGCPGHVAADAQLDRGVRRRRAARSSRCRPELAVARSAVASSRKLSARASASAAISRSIAAREARSCLPARRNVAP